MEKRKYEDLDVTERYELSMLMNTYTRMNVGPVIPFFTT